MDETPILQVDWGQLVRRDATELMPIAPTDAPAPHECALCLEELPAFEWPGKPFVSTCAGCGYRCCTTCLERAFFARPTPEPCCPNDACRVEIPRYVVVRCFDKACLGRIRAASEKLLMDVERAKFPAAMHCAELLTSLTQLAKLHRAYGGLHRTAEKKSDDLRFAIGNRRERYWHRPSRKGPFVPSDAYTQDEVRVIKAIMDEADLDRKHYKAMLKDVHAAVRFVRCQCVHRLDGANCQVSRMAAMLRPRHGRVGDEPRVPSIETKRLRQGVAYAPPAFDVAAEMAAKPIREVSQAEHFATIEAYLTGRPAPTEYEVLDAEELEAARKEAEDSRFERVTYFAPLGADATIAAADRTPEQVYRCPVVDCGGFLSIGSWTCLKCKALACKTCLCAVAPGSADDEARGAARRDHVCDPDTVLTVRMLRKETRPCPRCAFRIVRSAGCDVMFCTQCHTGFHWRTGEILAAGRVHNPHFFEWAQRQRQAAIADGTAGAEDDDDDDPNDDAGEPVDRALGRRRRDPRRRRDDPCNPNQLIQRRVRDALERIASNPAFRDAYERLPPADRMATPTAANGEPTRFRRRRGDWFFHDQHETRLSAHVYGILDVIGNIEDHARQGFALRTERRHCPTCAEPVPADDGNFDLRVRFLSGSLPEADFKSKIYERARAVKLQVAIGQLNQMFASVLAQACVKLVRDHRRDKTGFGPVLEFSREVRALIDHCTAKSNEIRRSFDKKPRPFCSLNDYYGG